MGAVKDTLQRTNRYLRVKSKVVAIGVVEADFSAAHETINPVLGLDVVAIVITVIDPLKRNMHTIFSS